MNKKSITGILLIALPLSVLAISITEVKGKFECPNIWNEQECASKFEAAFQKKNGGLIKREGKNVLIRLQNGLYRAIEDEKERYNFLEIAGQGDYLIIREQFWEGNTWHIFNLESGEMIETKGYPLFSPDSKSVVCAQRDLEAGYSPNILDIYEIKAQKFKRVFSVPLGEASWGPGEVKWESNSVIKFLKITLNPEFKLGNPNSHYLKTDGALEKHKNIWSISLNKKIQSAY